VREVANTASWKTIEYGNTSKALGTLARPERALSERRRSGDIPLRPRDRASPFHSTKDRIARATEALTFDSPPLPGFGASAPNHAS